MPHIHELIDFVVTVYIVYGDKVLLVFHKQLQKWLPIGGHIELDEDPEQALFREIQEECGLEVEILSSKPDIGNEGRKPLLTPNYLDIHKISDTHSHTSLTYFARAKSDTVMLAEREHEDIRWFSEADLENPKFQIQKDIKFYIKEAIKKAKL
mgnify:CR=1 FL=1